MKGSKMFKERWIWAATLLIMVAFGVGSWALSGKKGQRGRESEASYFMVERGPLTIHVRAPGTIRSQKAVVLKSKVEGRTTILWLIPEGSPVKKGDLLLELDSSDLEDKKLQQQIKVRNAEAAFVRARENLAVVQNQAESDIAEADLNERFAGIDLEKYNKGEFPQQKKQSENDIIIAEEELKRAEEKLNWSKTLAEEGYITRSEMEADALEYKKRELNLQMARRKLGVLLDYTHPRELARLKSDLEQASRAVDRVKRKASADILQAEAELEAKNLEFEREKDRLEKVLRQIENCRVTAPVDGMVVYATTGQSRRHRNQNLLAEGEEVSEDHRYKNSNLTVWPLPD